MNNLRVLQAQRAKVADAMRAISGAATGKAEDGTPTTRDLTEDEQRQYDAHRVSLASINAAIEREQELSQIDASAPAAATVAGNGRVEMGVERKTLDPKAGFASKGDFYNAVIRAGASMGRSIDPRLVPQAVAPTTYGNEAAGTDGGFIVPPEFATEIFTLALTDDALLPLVDGTPVQGNSMVFPKDETTPWGTDGIRAYWQAEASVATQTKPKLGTTMLRLHKLMGLVPLSDELVEDSRAGAAFVTPLIARSIRWKTNEALLYGTGAGQPMGMLTNAGNTNVAAIVQAKDSGQATKTVSVTNVANMVSRLVPGTYGESVWLIAPDAFPTVMTMSNSNGFPLWMPFNQGVQGSPYGMLLGRPVMLSQHAAAFSSQGDISLIVPSWYRAITKAGEGIETDVSMHIYFDADAVAFRSIFRLDGGPKILNPVTQAKGTNTLSPFVTLAAR